MLEEYDVVRLKYPLADSTVPPGARGTVLMVWTEPRVAYEVEFVADTGASLGSFTVEAAQVEKWHDLAVASDQRT